MEIIISLSIVILAVFLIVKTGNTNGASNSINKH